MRSRALAVCALAVLLGLTGARSLPRQGFVPKNGFVPDARTAILIAEAVLAPVYGEAQVAHERPFKAALKDGVWTVKGYLPPHLVGGTAEVQIAKKDARILSMTHGQ